MNPSARLTPPLLAVASGLSLLVAHPPVGWWPATFVGPALLLAALWTSASTAPARPARSAMLLGTLAGAACFGPMLTWLILPAGVLGWALLAGIQALWMGVLALLVRPFLDRWWLPAVLAVTWTGVDAWRALVPLSGFEWGAIAYAHTDGSWMLPVARLVGARGITFLVVLIGGAAAVLVRRTWQAQRDRGDEPLDRVLGTTRGPAALLVGGLLASVLLTIEPPPQTGDLDVLVVQGNDVRHWEEGVVDPDPPLRITTALRDETLAAIDEGGRPELTVWPESSIDRDPTRGRGQELAALADDAARAAGRLLVGVGLDGPDPATERWIAALLLEDGFDERDRYLKRRLVPFGEYIPARPLLDWFPPLDQIPRDAVAGPGPQAVEVVDGVRAAVIVCFETLFPDIVRTNLLADEEPADLIVTVTNDASFGDSAEPAQHLAQSQLRAVESGRWVVHAALTGSSAFVSPDGEIEQATALFERATIRTDVPLVEGSTPFLVIGGVVGAAARAGLIAVVGVVAIAALRRQRAGEQGAGEVVHAS